MGILKITSGVLAVLAVSLLVVGGLGFTSVAAERGVDVSVVPDDEAFVGYDAEDVLASSGDTVELVTVANRLPGDIQVKDVEISGDEDLEISDVSKPAIDSGESAPVEGTVKCQEPVETEVEVTITLEGDGVWVELFGDSRSFDISCHPGEGAGNGGPPEFVPPDDLDDVMTEHGVWYSGTGNAVVYHENDSVAVRVWGFEGDNAGNAGQDITELDDLTVASGEPVRNKIATSNGATIVAVTLEDEGITYIHPQFDVGTGTFEGSKTAGWGEAFNGTEPSSWTE